MKQVIRVFRNKLLFPDVLFLLVQEGTPAEIKESGSVVSILDEEIGVLGYNLYGKESDFEQLTQDGLPTTAISGDIPLVDALIQTKLAQSKTQAREFIQSGAVVINGKKAQNLETMITLADKRFNRYTLLRRGKKNHSLLISE